MVQLDSYMVVDNRFVPYTLDLCMYISIKEMPKMDAVLCILRISLCYSIYQPRLCKCTPITDRKRKSFHHRWI